MRLRFFLATAAAAFLVASAVAHAFLGWPSLAEELIASNVDGSHIVGLRTGWYFGSAAMLVFAAIAGREAHRLRTGHQATSALLIVGVGYAGFGVVAWLLQGLDPQFLSFVGIGVLLVLAWRRRHSRPGGQ